jgi:SAM-dependent methyltransferase
MLGVARRSHPGSSVRWVGLPPDWDALPLADGSLDGVVASSVFEYLADPPRVAAELARVLRPGGVLLLTVPNPRNGVRKIEAGLQSLPMVRRLEPALRPFPRLHSYAAYLRLSRNRFPGPAWLSILSAGDFAPLDKNDFCPETWQAQAKAPLIFLAVKKVGAAAKGGAEGEGSAEGGSRDEDGHLVAERPVARLVAT